MMCRVIVLIQIIFENESKMAYISSMEQFFKWFNGEATMIADDQGIVDRASHWGYFDYNYVFDVMDPKNIDDINWRHLGLDVNPVDSTIWIGIVFLYLVDLNKFRRSQSSFCYFLIEQ